MRMGTHSFRQLTPALALVLGMAGPAHAGDVPELASAPEGDPILNVTGAIEQTNDGDSLAFDIDMLESLGATSFTTTTIWTDGEIEFTGIRLARLLRMLQVDDGQVELIALNDYIVQLPVEAALESEALIAYRLNGAPMSIRDKGPLWMVYPYDSDSRYQTEGYYAKSIWQINRIRIHD